MQRSFFASLLAHVLASTALVACGGSVEAPGTHGSSTSGGEGTSTSPTAPPSASCTTAPVLARHDGCAEIWYHACGVPEGVNADDGLASGECAKVCGPMAASPGYYDKCDVYHLDRPGAAFECYTCTEGRRPQGYSDGALEPTVAGWLAHAADLERVSIDAFQILRRELTHYGAPLELLQRARRAERDEVAHARLLGSLARREGATLSTEPVVHGPVRSLVEIARENAVEGCIRETYGAVVAGFQAEHAERSDIRRAMKKIYRDETTHAELAWQVHAWIIELLAPDERAAIERAMAAAVAELRASADIETPPELVAELGLPPAHRARRLVEGLRVHLWADARAA